MSEELQIPFWWTEYAKICQRIRESTGTLKIVLKTKDDHYFVDKWVKHHIKIVGGDNLVIFDNMSTNSEVLTYYSNLPTEILVVRYDKFHNFIHSVEIFRHLYDALIDSCQYFCILDTDEYLTLVESDFKISTDDSIDFLKTHSKYDVFPGTWLHNCVRSEHLFSCGTQRTLDDGLRWGKPILRASPALKGIILHNCEAPSSMYVADTPVNFFILHMTNLYPEQRIEANLRKIVARNFARPDETVEAILSKDRSGIEDQNITRYLNEIEQIIGQGIVPEAQLTDGVVDFGSSERLIFGCDSTKIILDQYLKSGAGNSVDRIFLNGAG